MKIWLFYSSFPQGTLQKTGFVVSRLGVWSDEQVPI